MAFADVNNIQLIGRIDKQSLIELEHEIIQEVFGGFNSVMLPEEARRSPSVSIFEFANRILTNSDYLSVITNAQSLVNLQHEIIKSAFGGFDKMLIEKCGQLSLSQHFKLEQCLAIHDRTN